MECQIVKKENDVSREKRLCHQMTVDVEKGQQQTLELRDQVEHLKDDNHQLQREIKALNDIISEQKVCRRQSTR